MDKRFAIWVPILPEHGLGHFYRSYSLYESFEDSHFFFNKKPSFNVEERHYCIDSEDPEEIYSFLVENNISVLLIDNYFLSEEILSRLSMSEEIKVIYFLKSSTGHSFSVYLNNNPFINEINLLYPENNSTKIFLGSGYYKFRKKICEVNSDIKRDSEFICFGGSDVKHLSYKVLRNLSAEKQYILVIGAGASKEYVDKVRKEANRLSVNVFIHHDPPNFYELLAQSKTAILSSSTITYEASYLDVQFVCIQTADNQNDLVTYLKKNKIHVLDEIEKIKKLENEYNKLNVNFGNEFCDLLEYIRNCLNGKV